MEFGEDCLRNGTRHRLSPLLRDFLHAYLPPDAHERCAGNTHVAWTRALPYWRPQLVRLAGGGRPPPNWLRPVLMASTVLCWVTSPGCTAGSTSPVHGSALPWP